MRIERIREKTTKIKRANTTINPATILIATAVFMELNISALVNGNTIKDLEQTEYPPMHWIVIGKYVSFNFL